MLEEKFIEAIAYWKLEVLYVSLESAKQQVHPGKHKKLTAIEQACLRGLLCRYSPSEIAHELYREPRGLRVDLSRGLYRYIETLTNQQLKDWRDVSRLLAAGGYQKAANFVPRLKTDNLWLPVMLVSKL
jgi:hypothetical protein